MSKELLQKIYSAACTPFCNLLPVELLIEIEAELEKDIDCVNHEIADASNIYVESGYYCVKCGQLFKSADIKAELAKTEQVKQKPLSEELIQKISNEFTEMFRGNFDLFIHENNIIQFTREIEKHHGIK